MPNFASNLKTNRNVCSAAITDLRWILPNSIFYVLFGFSMNEKSHVAIFKARDIVVFPGFFQN